VSTRSGERRTRAQPHTKNQTDWIARDIPQVALHREKRVERRERRADIHTRRYQITEKPIKKEKRKRNAGARRSALVAGWMMKVGKLLPPTPLRSWGSNVPTFLKIADVPKGNGSEVLRS
jgi:hypothetical protein